MNLVQNITTIIFGMHEQLSCQCLNIHLGMRDGKMATDEELLTMQRTLNVIKSLRKELEMVTAGMVVVEQPMQEKATTHAPVTAPPQPKAATPPPPKTATSSKGTDSVATKGTAPAFLAPEPKVNPALFTPEMAAVINGSNKPQMRGITGFDEPRKRVPVGRR